MSCFKLDVLFPCVIRLCASEPLWKNKDLKISGQEKNRDRLDKLEGNDIDLKVCEIDEEIVLFEEEENVEMLVHKTLKEHLGFWKESGASQFALSLIEHGYRLPLKANRGIMRRKITSLI